MRMTFTIYTQIFLLFFVSVIYTSSAQVLSELNYKEIEVIEYEVGKDSNMAVLEMAYAQHTIDNPEVWKSVGDNASVESVDLVFTKYPRHKRDWITDYDFLLNARVKNIMDLVPCLKQNKSVKWNIVLQNKCVKEPEAMAMFHGAVVHYKKEEPEPVIGSAGLSQTENEIDRIPPKPKPILEKKDAPEPTDGDRYKYIGFYDVHQILHGKLPIKDSLIFHVFERNPQWQNMLVVSDWTASMYVYGTQAVMWQKENLDNQKIAYFVFFNDGNKKKNDKKEPGKTGGIYSIKAENTDKVIKTMRKVMEKGQGGDREENDIEALQYALNKYEEAEELILIADNKSEVRDLSLINKLEKPVRVIVCGTSKAAIREDYIKLAMKTGGSLHTLTADYKNLHELSEGETIFIEDVRYQLVNHQLKMITDILD